MSIDWENTYPLMPEFANEDALEAAKGIKFLYSFDCPVFPGFGMCSRHLADRLRFARKAVADACSPWFEVQNHE